MGAEIVATIRIIATTIIISMSEKPCAGLRSWFRLVGADAWC
jgi:hypothetical protein